MYLAAKESQRLKKLCINESRCLLEFAVEVFSLNYDEKPDYQKLKTILNKEKRPDQKKMKRFNTKASVQFEFSTSKEEWILDEI